MEQEARLLFGAQRKSKSCCIFIPNCVCRDMFICEWELFDCHRHTFPYDNVELVFVGVPRGSSFGTLCLCLHLPQFHVVGVSQSRYGKLDAFFHFSANIHLSNHRKLLCWVAGFMWRPGAEEPGPAAGVRDESEINWDVSDVWSC